MSVSYFHAGIRRAALPREDVVVPVGIEAEPRPLTDYEIKEQILEFAFSMLARFSSMKALQRLTRIS
jgi:hypothetical protein